MEGYFKVNRKIIDSPVFAHPVALKIWIWCLARTTYRERFIAVKIGRGETTVRLLPGQFLFGRFKAEEELNIDGSTIYKWMQKFESPGFDMISIESNNQYSIITICNYDQYNNLEQNEVATKEQPSDNQVTTKEQPRNNQVTTKEQPCNTNNKDKNIKKVKKDKNKVTFDLLFIQNSEFIPVWNKWLNYKKKLGKPYRTQEGMETKYKELLSLSDNNPTTAMAIVDQSIGNEWAGLFELKTSRKTSEILSQEEDPVERDLRLTRETRMKREAREAAEREKTNNKTIK